MTFMLPFAAKAVDQGQARTFQLAQSTGCPRAEVVDSFETRNFYVFICSGQGGYLFYRGVDKDTGSGINLSTTTDRFGGYVSTNGEYTYRVNSSALRVFKGDRLIVNEKVIGK